MLGVVVELLLHVFVAQILPAEHGQRQNLIDTGPPPFRQFPLSLGDVYLVIVHGM